MTQIRLAAREDVAALAALVERYWEFESIPGFARPRLESLLQSLIAEPLRGVCWVAESQGRLVGYMLAVFVFSLEHGGIMAEIDELFVADHARSSGTGALLVTGAERDLAERGLRRLQLQLGVANHRARRFYERHGFSERADYQLLDKSLDA
jgi:GNAT superfamily N-acetyltransferase